MNPIAGEAGANSGGDCFVLQARQSGPNGDPYLAGFANDLSSGTVPAANQLTFTVATYDGTTATLYWAYGVTGAVHSVSAAYSFTTTGSNFDIGYDFEEPSQNDMQIGQVLVYENSLNATAATDEIESLQSEYAAPEPTTWALIMSGGGPVFLVARRRFIA